MKLEQLFILILFIGFMGCSVQKYNSEDYSQYKVYTNLKKALKNKADVKVLVLASDGLKDFPMEITELINLKVLNLSNNEITHIPKEISDLKQLERLELMKNKLNGLPIEITDLKNLKRINIAHNGINNEDVQLIKEALPDCFIITEIVL
ncbi:leucine-rich repeat domain-containing protein [Roseivirga sp. BDSF3-8]|uniref:leucine-rich repeat domain-containing protein n=1 Tax=Roseivirga sp. BDSF3-8 TaxID=3241598 RepID=UPI003531F30B